MANPFYIEPANPLQALMMGVQGYERGQKSAKEAAQAEALRQAVPLMQQGDHKNALALLMGAGNLQGAQLAGTIANNEADRQWRREEATRSQGNTDRSFTLQQQQIGATAANTAATRAMAERQFQFQQDQANKPEKGFTRNPDGSLAPVPGGPADPNYLRSVDSAKSGGDITRQIEERRNAIAGQGLDPNDPHNRAYILTGKMPREDQQPLTATDKKAILEADEGVAAAESSILALRKAKDISGKAYEVPLASQRGYAAGLFGNNSGQATTDLNNLVTGNALTQMKAIFGGNPTEGERQILLDIQGSASQPDAVRQKIYDRAIAAAERRLGFNRQRATEMRGGTFYKPQGGIPQAAPQQQTSGPITQEQYMALPPGSPYTAPDGTQRVKR